MALQKLLETGKILAAAAGLMLFAGGGVCAEKDEQPSGEDLYIVNPWTRESPDRKIVFAGCDTPENYARYSKALHDNASDAVLTELRSEEKCIILSSRDFIYYRIKIQSMDKDTGRVTAVIRDFGGITDGPFFTDIVPDKIFIRNRPYGEVNERRRKEIRDLFTKNWVGKVFVMEHSRCFFASLPEYQQYLYESGKAKDLLMTIDFRRAGRCLVLEKGTLVQVVSTDDMEITEYKVLSGEYKGRTVYQDREHVQGKPMILSE